VRDNGDSMITKESLCDRCLAHFEYMIAIGRPADMEFCKKCVAKIHRVTTEECNDPDCSCHDKETP
jgi:NMD protein affecting ribosome stability and mRNA decay